MPGPAGVRPECAAPPWAAPPSRAATGASASRPGSPLRRRMSRFARRLLADECGLETAEYAIIAGMILTGLIAVVIALGRWVRREMTALKTHVGA